MLVGAVVLVTQLVHRVETAAEDMEEILEVLVLVDPGV
jgi:hypothetical protein